MKVIGSTVNDLVVLLTPSVTYNTPQLLTVTIKYCQSPKRCLAYHKVILQVAYEN